MDSYVVYVLACLRVQILMHVWGFGGQTLIGVRCLPQLLSMSFLRQGPLLNLELKCSARLAGQQTLRILQSLSPVLGLQACITGLDFSHACWELNSGPHTCVASTLWTDPMHRSLNPSSHSLSTHLPRPSLPLIRL